MLHRTYSDQDCSVARALEVVGETPRCTCSACEAQIDSAGDVELRYDGADTRAA